MCSVKIKNGTEYTDRCSFCPRPQHFSKSCWEPMTTTCRPGAAQTLGNPSPQANPQDLHRDSAVISFSCPGYQWWPFHSASGSRHLPCSQIKPVPGVQDPRNGSMSFSCYSRTGVWPWSSWASEPEVGSLVPLIPQLLGSNSFSGFSIAARYEQSRLWFDDLPTHSPDTCFHGPALSRPKLGLPLYCLILRFAPTDFPIKQ